MNTEQHLWNIAYANCNGSQDRANEIYNTLKTKLNMNIQELEQRAKDGMKDIPADKFVEHILTELSWVFINYEAEEIREIKRMFLKEGMNDIVEKLNF